MSSAGPRYFALLTSIACLIGVGACGLVVGDLPEAKKEGSGGDGGNAGGGSGGEPGGAGGGGGSGPCSADNGDADGDGVKRTACEGLDCDDGNGDVFPGQEDWFDTPRGNGSFDYNCDRSEEPEHKSAVACPLTGGCGQGEGFLVTLPACGAPGKWGFCIRPSVVTCGEDVRVPGKKLTCR